MTLKKYEKDKQLKSLLQAVRLIRDGHPVFFRHKFLSAKFIENWRLKQIRETINNGYLYSVRKIK